MKAAPSSFTSYPSVLNLGHKDAAALFTVPLIVQEKIDGSQFSFCVDENGDLHIRSHHNSINPDHILLHPTTHDPIYLGWAHSLDTSKGIGRIQFAIDKWHDWYPPEVLRKEKPTERTDIYMVGETLITLFGDNTKSKSLPKDLPADIASIIRGAVSEDPSRRPIDAYSFMQDMTSAIRRNWGKAYQPLVMPVGKR